MNQMELIKTIYKHQRQSWKETILTPSGTADASGSSTVLWTSSGSTSPEGKTSSDGP